MYTTRILFRLLDVIVGFLEIIIGLRIILKLFGANPFTPFVAWVYETSRPLLSPFLGMFPSPTLKGGFVIEFSALFALIIYAFLAAIIEEILNQFASNTRERELQRKHK